MRADWGIFVFLDWWVPASEESGQHSEAATQQHSNGRYEQFLALYFKGQAMRMFGGRPRADPNVLVQMMHCKGARRAFWLSVLLLLCPRLRSSMEILAGSLNYVPVIPEPSSHLPLIRWSCKAVITKRPVRVLFQMLEKDWHEIAPLLSFVTPVMLSASIAFGWGEVRYITLQYGRRRRRQPLKFANGCSRACRRAITKW